MPTFGDIGSPFANQLMDVSQIGAVIAQERRNALMFQDQRAQRQQEQGIRDRDYAARLAGSLRAMPAEQRASAYATGVQEAQAMGFMRNAPLQYPGDHTLDHVIRMGMSASQQSEAAERDTNRSAALQAAGSGTAPIVTAPSPAAMPTALAPPSLPPPGQPRGDAPAFVTAGLDARRALDPNSLTYIEDLQRINNGISGQTLPGVRPQPVVGEAPQGAIATIPPSAPATPARAPAPLSDAITSEQQRALDMMARSANPNPAAIAATRQQFIQYNQTRERERLRDDEQRTQQRLTNERQGRAETRAEEEARLRREQAGIPNGFERNPDGPGVRPIQGGPADPAVIERATQARGGGGRPLPTPAITRLGEMARTAEQLAALNNTFHPDYGGFGTDMIGGAANLIARNTPGDSPRASWWQQYDALANIERNELFGASLTGSEQAAWRAAAIGPGMSAEAIRTNLARRSEIAQTAFTRYARSHAANGYNPQAIAEASGMSLEALTGPRQPSAEPPAAAAASQPARQGGGGLISRAQARNAPPVSVQTPAEAQALAPGTIYTTPDGRRFKR